MAAPLNPARATLAPWFPLATAGTGGALLLSALAHLHAAAVVRPGGPGAAGPPGSGAATAAALGRLALLGAGLGVALCLVALWARRRHPSERLVHAVLSLALVADGLDALATVVLTGSLERLLDAALTIVAAGGLLTDRRWSLAVVATVTGAWTVTASGLAARAVPAGVAVLPGTVLPGTVLPGTVGAMDARPYQVVVLLAALATAAAVRERRRPAGRRRPE